MNELFFLARKRKGFPKMQRFDHSSAVFLGLEG